MKLQNMLMKMLTTKFSVKILIAILSFLILYNIIDTLLSVFSLKEGLEGNENAEEDVYTQNNQAMQSEQNKEYQDYSAQQITPMVLAQKNQANIMALRDQLSKLGNIQKLISDLTNRVDRNEKSIEVLTNTQTAQQQTIAKKNEQRALLDSDKM